MSKTRGEHWSHCKYAVYLMNVCSNCLRLQYAMNSYKLFALSAQVVVYVGTPSVCILSLEIH
jgi:hypothetical protein